MSGHERGDGCLGGGGVGYDRPSTVDSGAWPHRAEQLPQQGEDRHAQQQRPQGEIKLGGTIVSSSPPGAIGASQWNDTGLLRMLEGMAAKFAHNTEEQQVLVAAHGRLSILFKERHLRERDRREHEDEKEKLRHMLRGAEDRLRLVALALRVP